MAWTKRPRRAPVDLGTAHLNTITTANEQGYTQIFAARATKAQGYPYDGIAGHLQILPWNASTGSVIAVFTSWNGGIAKRVFYNGVWQSWLDASGKAVP